MTSELDTFAALAIAVVIWWFGVRALVGQRLGVFHWAGVAIAWLGIPGFVADATFQYPSIAAWFCYAWHGVGLGLALRCLSGRATLIACDDEPTRTDPFSILGEPLNEIGRRRTADGGKADPLVR